MRTLVRWNPSPALTPRNDRSEFEREFQGLFNWALGEPKADGAFAPATDLIEEKDRYQIQIDLPGLKKEDIEVSFKEGVLSVRGERTSQTEKEKDGRVVRQERFAGSFERRFKFTQKVDPSRMEAAFADGVLRLEIPFLPEVQPLILDVK